MRTGMKQTLTKDRTIFALDLDETLYSLTDAGISATAFFGDAKARAVPKLLPHLSQDEIRAIGKKSYDKYHDGLKLYAVIAEEHGHDIITFERLLHREFNMASNAIAEESETFRNLFKACATTKENFVLLGDHVRFGVLTHSCRETWAVPRLQALDYLEHMEVVLGLPDTDFVSKSVSGEPLTAFMQQMGAHPHQVVFCDDNTHILKIAKEHHPEILTVQVCHGKIDEDVPSHIDLRVNRFYEVQNEMIKILGIEAPARKRSGLELHV